MVAVLVLTGLCVLLALLCPPSWQPWVQLAATALVATLVTVRRDGRPLLSRPTPPRSAPVDVVDLVAPDRSLVGCVEGEQVVTTAVEVTSGTLHATEVGGDSPADFRGVRIPLAAVAAQLDQGGVVLEGVDVVVRGRRAADGPDGGVYGDLVGPLALISHRRIVLLLRFDLTRLALDGGTTLEHVVTVATERLRRTLVHHGLPCRVLDATGLADVYLEAEAEPASGTGLVVHPAADTRAVVDTLSAIPAAEVTEVQRLRRVEGRDDLVDVVTTVGLAGTGREALPADAVAHCTPLDSARVLPVPGEPMPDRVRAHLARRRAGVLDPLSPPAHGAGQILGATRVGAAAAFQLAGPHLRSVLLSARPRLCRQVVFRTVAAGYRVAVVTDVPDRWRPLSAIGDESRYRIVDPEVSDPGAPVDAVVWDVARPLTEGRIDAFAGPGGPDVTPPTVIRVDADWDVGGPPPHAPGTAPDLVVDGRIDGWISVEPRAGEPQRVAVVSGPGEEVFVGR